MMTFIHTQFLDYAERSIRRFVLACPQHISPHAISACHDSRRQHRVGVDVSLVTWIIVVQNLHFHVFDR